MCHSGNVRRRFVSTWGWRKRVTSCELTITGQTYYMRSVVLLTLRVKQIPCAFLNEQEVIFA